MLEHDSLLSSRQTEHLIQLRTASRKKHPKPLYICRPHYHYSLSESLPAPLQSSVYSVIADAVAASLAGALPPKHCPTITDGGLVVRERYVALL
jgi:hypothetical protein